MDAKLISIILAIAITLAIGWVIPVIVDNFNTNTYGGNITLMDQPALARALHDSQAKGVILGIYGSKDDDFTTLSPSEAKEIVASDVSIFNKSGLTPTVYISPTVSMRSLTYSVRDAIESAGVSTMLPLLQTNNSKLIEYGVGWGNMKDSSDPRYASESQKIKDEQPTSILIYAADWNPYLKSLISGYLSSTSQRNITVRVDNVGVNTPASTITDMDSLLQYPSVGRVLYAIAPAGVKDADPAVGGISVNNVLKFYWWFFVLSAFFPLLFFIFWMDIEKLKERRRKKASEGKAPAEPYLPFVSIVIPAYNESKGIRRCMEAVLGQDYKGPMEVIAINDGSTDNTAEIIAQYPVKLIDLKKNVGKAEALNIGLTRVSGDIIVFSDSDSFIASDAVSALIKKFEECPDADIVAGNIYVGYPNGKRGRLLRLFQIIEYTMEQKINRYLQSLKGAILVCPGPLFACKRHVTEKIKYSNKTLVEDADFTIHALKCKMKIIWGPKARVYTTPPDTVWKWYKQRKRWWYGNLQIWKLHNSFVRKNPWFLLSYLGFVMGFLSILMFPIPIILLAFQANMAQVAVLGLLYILASCAAFSIVVTRFYYRDWKLMLLLVPYMIFYNTMKGLVVGYIYFCYLKGGTTKIQFGSRIINASCSQ